MIRNILFIVEGKTEGLANPSGKGIQNLLRVECDFMRDHQIGHHTIRKNGKRDLLSDVGFDVFQHLVSSKKMRDKLDKHGSPVGDYVFILRDLDCEEEEVVRKNLLTNIETRFHDRVEVHFAVQEIEAWMIADPEGFCAVYKRHSSVLLNELKKLVPVGQSPESLDCNPKPAKRLEKITEKLNLTYTKTRHGPMALGLVNPDIIAERCPHFKAFRDSLREKIGYPQ